MFHAKNYLNRPVFHGVIQKITLAQFGVHVCRSSVCSLNRHRSHTRSDKVWVETWCVTMRLHWHQPDIHQSFCRHMLSNTPSNSLFTTCKKWLRNSQTLNKSPFRKTQKTSDLWTS